MRNNDGETPLHMACWYNNVPAAVALLARPGVEVTLLTDTHLVETCRGLVVSSIRLPHSARLTDLRLVVGQQRDVRYLVLRDGVLQVLGVAPLGLIKEYHQVENLRILSEVDGTDWNIQNFSGLTPAMLSMKYGYSDAVKVLAGIDNVDWNIRGMMGETAVSLAMNHFYTHCLKVLAECRLQEDVNWNVHDYTAYFMVSIVAARGDYELLEILSRIDRMNWNIDGPYGHVLKFALTLEDASQRSRIVQILLSVPDLDLNISDVFHELKEVAVEECKQYILGIMSQDEHLQGQENVTELVYVLTNNLERFEKILGSAGGAVGECRNYIRGVMDRDETLLAENNLTAFVYALIKNMEKFVEILASDLQNCDILCLILHSRL